MTTASATLAARPLTLEQLAALSEEIGALARAGVPLDRGLRELATDMPGRLGKMADQLGRQLEQGRRLEDAVADLGAALPPAYRTVIDAGLKAGRLPAAMEDISRTARRLDELRNSIYLSLVYPLVVLIVAWGLSIFMLTSLGPILSRMLVEFDVTGPWIIDWYAEGAKHIGWLGPLVPIAFALWLLWAWYRCGKVAAGLELHPLLSLGAVGTLARMQRASRLASLADLLSLLIEHGVPLPEAVELSSSAIGSPAIATSGRQFAEQLRRGENIERPPHGFPPLLAWTIAGGQPQSRLISSLRRTAEVYRDEVARRSQWLGLYVPILSTLVICGGVVCLYALVTLGPWIMIMRRLALPY
jgi:general secretion pathway protein F